MGILSSLREALGLSRPLISRPAPPFTLGPRAVQAIHALPKDQAVHLVLRPDPRGFQLHAISEAATEAPHPFFEGLRVQVDDPTLRTLSGVILDRDAKGWIVRAPFKMRATETPNPDSRLYSFDRKLSEGSVIWRPETKALPPLARDLLDASAVVMVMVRENTLTVEREKGAPWDPIDALVKRSIETHLVHTPPLFHAEPKARGPRGSLEQEIWAVLERTILPGIHADGGDMVLLGVDDGVVQVRLVGACRSCPASELTVTGGIARILKDAFPTEVHEVKAV